MKINFFELPFLEQGYEDYVFGRNQRYLSLLHLVEAFCKNKIK